MENLNLNIDEEFWKDFVQESCEHVEDIEMNILTLEKEPENSEIINSMFRAFHTIKGLSGFVEHVVIQEIAHKTETLMDYCRKGETKVNTDIINAILKSSDYIKNLSEDINAYKDEDFMSEISEHLKKLDDMTNAIEQSLSGKSVSPEENEPASEMEVKRDAEAFMSEDFSAIVKEEEKEEEPAEPALKEETPQPPAPKVQATPEPESIPERRGEDRRKVQLEGFGPENDRRKEDRRQKSTNEEYMRVSNSRIDHLVDTIGELIISQSLIKDYVASHYSQDHTFVKNLDAFSRVTRELQDISTFLRSISLKSTFQKITRIARDTISELNKDIEFITSGESTEIDRAVADKLLDPLVHLIKNAISHGVEVDPQDRVNKGKDAKAKVELHAYNKRGKIYIEVKDDGRGINTDVVYKKALEKGLIDPNHEYSQDEIKEFIMLPGFSTAEKVDNISGRGVGMDVVKTHILKIGGKVSIMSELGLGSTFTLEVPINHAIMNGIIVDICSEHFILPTMNVKEILKPRDDQWISSNNRQKLINVRDVIIPVVPPEILAGSIKEDCDFEFPLVVLLEMDRELRALPITNIISREELVVKPVGDEFANLKYLSGMSILGNGKVSLILDVSYLFQFNKNDLRSK